MQKYYKTIDQLIGNKEALVSEMSLYQQTQTAILRNDYYQIKDRDTQAVFESILKINQHKEPTNNHQKGYDLTYGGEKISIKSGTVKNDQLTFSYSRTTAYPTLEEKIEYLSTFDNLILGIASEQFKPNVEDVNVETNYYLYYFCANEIDLRRMDWKENESSWIGINEKNNIKVDIKKKLSDQPWISIPLNLVNCELVMNSTVISKNNKKFLIIENPQTFDISYYDLYDFRKKIKSIKGVSCKKSTTKNVMG